MKRMSRICCTLALLLSSLSAVPTAHAALKARSTTIDPATGYPTWYQDTNNLALTDCLDKNGFCLAAFPALPLPADRANISAANFPDESFYYMADTSGASPGGTINVIVWEAALEAGFASAVQNNGQAVFTRIRYRVNVTVPGTYTITHPYGVETYVIAAGDILPGNTTPEINFTNDVPGLVPGDFDSAVTPGIGFSAPFVGPTFLTNADGTFITDPASGNRYIGLPGAPVAVTGGLNGINSVTITGPTADTFLSNTFGLQGKVIGLDVAPKTKFDLGKVTIPAASAPQTITVTNTTGNPIIFPAPVVTPATASTNATDFVIAPPAAAGAVDCFGATPLAPAAACSFDVTFFPAATAPATTPPTAPTAARSASIILAPTNSPAAVGSTDPPPVTINLSGTAQYALTVTVASAIIATPGNNGTGTVSSNLAGITNCSATGGTCTASFDVGFSVALTPTAATSPLSIFHEWIATPTEITCSGTAPCTLIMDGPKNVTANFIQVYNIITSATPTAGGTISTNSVVEHGNSQSLVITPTVTPATRYRFLTLTDNANPVTPVLEPGTNSFIFSLENVTANHAVAASFIQQFILTPSVTGVGGAITPAIPVTLDAGATGSFTVTSDAGYRIGPVLVDNVAQTVTATPFNIPVSSVTADHSINASFVKIWNVTSGAGANGSVDKPGIAVLDQGATPSYTFTPSSNKFQVGKILIGDAVQTFTKPAALAGAVTFTLPAVTEDKIVNATFVPSGDLDGSGTVDVNDALKAMKILLKLHQPVGDELAAMKVSPLDASGLPSGSGEPTLSDAILILKRAVKIVTW